jgi:hypothetical protein
MSRVVKRQLLLPFVLPHLKMLPSRACRFPLDRLGMMRVHLRRRTANPSLHHAPRRHTLGVASSFRASDHYAPPEPERWGGAGPFPVGPLASPGWRPSGTGTNWRWWSCASRPWTSTCVNCPVTPSTGRSRSSNCWMSSISSSKPSRDCGAKTNASSNDWPSMSPRSTAPERPPNRRPARRPTAWMPKPNAAADANAAARNPRDVWVSGGLTAKPRTHTAALTR